MAIKIPWNPHHHGQIPYSENTMVSRHEFFWWIHMNQVAIESTMPEKELPGPGSYEPPVRVFMNDDWVKRWRFQGISPGKDGDFRGGLPKKNDEQIGIDIFFSEIEWNRMGWHRICTIVFHQEKLRDFMGIIGSWTWELDG